MKTFVSSRAPSHSAHMEMGSLLQPIINYARRYEKGELYTLSKEELQNAQEVCYVLINFKNREEFLVHYEIIKNELEKINNLFLTCWLQNTCRQKTPTNTKHIFIDIMKFGKVQELLFSYLNTNIKRLFNEEPITQLLNDQFVLLFRQNSVTLRNLIFNAVESFDLNETRKLRLVLMNLKVKSKTFINDFFELTGNTIQRKVIQNIKKFADRNDSILKHDNFIKIYKYIEIFSVFMEMEEVMEVLKRYSKTNLQNRNVSELKEFISDSEQNKALLNCAKEKLASHFKGETVQIQFLQNNFKEFFKMNETLVQIFDDIIKEGKEAIKRDYVRRCIEESKIQKLESFEDFIRLTNKVNTFYEEVETIMEDIKNTDPISLRVFTNKGLAFTKSITTELVITLKKNNQSFILQKVAQIFRTYQYFVPLKDVIESFGLAVILNIFINGKMINSNLQSLLFGVFEKETKKERNYLRLIFNSFKNFKRSDKTDKISCTEIEFLLLKKLHRLFKFQRNVPLYDLVDDEKARNYSLLNLKCDLLAPFIIIETGSMVMLNVHYNVLKKIHENRLKSNPLCSDLEEIESLALKHLVKSKIVEEVEGNYKINNITEKSGKLVLDFLVETIYKETNVVKTTTETKETETRNTLLLEKIRFFIEERFETDEKDWSRDEITRLVQTKFKIGTEETDYIIKYLEKEQFIEIDRETGIVELL